MLDEIPWESLINDSRGIHWYDLKLKKLLWLLKRRRRKKRKNKEEEEGGRGEGKGEEGEEEAQILTSSF